GGKITLEVEEGLTVAGLIQKLRIAPELAQLVLVNGVDVGRDQDRVLQDGDTVGIFPPVAGGSAISSLSSSFPRPPLVKGNHLLAETAYAG
ncbi:MAG: MoaD/ThiS family protein, partial [Candidatus Methylomirabilales bacterium]